MNFRVNYIFRKRQSQYHSIENLFHLIKTKVSENFETNVIYAPTKGASPKVIIKNCLSLNKIKNSIYHITGDVHYMALVTGKYSVLTIHDTGSALKGNMFKRFYIKVFWFWLPALFVKRITVISEFTKKELEGIIPFAKYKIRVVYNPVNSLFQFSDYSFNKDCPKILCVGTKDNKNLERIFEAVKTIKCQLHIIGQVTSNQKKLLEELSINYCNSVGLSQEEIIKAYEECDLLCFPSVYEGFGMPIIEAQATGRPVVTSNFGAMLEVARDSACLVDAYNPSEIREAIQNIINDYDYRKNLINKGLVNVRRFQLNTIVNQYILIYKELGL